MTGSTFVLMMLLTPSSSFTSVAMTTVPGYTSLEACQAAGKSWDEQMQRWDGGWKWLCIPGPETR
jgi:hypothetical protein